MKTPSFGLNFGLKLNLRTPRTLFIDIGLAPIPPWMFKCAKIFFFFSLNSKKRGTDTRQGISIFMWMYFSNWQLLKFRKSWRRIGCRFRTKSLCLFLSIVLGWLLESVPFLFCFIRHFIINSWNCITIFRNSCNLFFNTCFFYCFS